VTEIRRDYSYASVPTIKRFSQSRAEIRGLMGPFGSGKSSGCVIELVKWASRQHLIEGKRRARFACIRNTYAQLQDTTIKTFLYWLPDRVFGTYRERDHSYRLDRLGDLEVEFIFRALDRPEHAANLLSLELTGAWANEARELPWAIIEPLRGRCGRYPPAPAGGAVDPGIIMDTNPPEEESWWYSMFEEHRTPDGTHIPPEIAQIFKQPSGLADNAENLPHLLNGRGYYEKLSTGANADFVRVYVHGLYGYVKDGKPVYPEYNDNLHCADLEPIHGTIRRGWDFGLTPACILTQVRPNGQWLVFDELCGDELGITGISTFADAVLRHCGEKYPDYRFEDFGDPAGEQRSPMTADREQKTCFDILRAKGIDIRGAEQNLTSRLECVRKPLNTLVDGRPQLQLHSRCKKLRKGFNGRYCYKRVKIAGAAERYHDEPDKNEYSHPHDGLQYVATSVFGLAIRGEKQAAEGMKLPSLKFAKGL
jgi:hypothetical protein